MEEIKEEVVPEREPTPEEVAEMTKKMDAYYDDRIPFLKKQLEYEELVTSIEVSRYRRLEAIIRQMQMEAGPKQAQETSAPKKERKLKQD